MTTLFGSDAAIKSILSLMQNKKLKFLKQIVIYDKECSTQLKELAAISNVTVYNYHELQSEMHTAGATQVQDLNDDLNSVFTISYTSGTSGNSKGVMLTNRNFLSAMMNIKAMCE